MISLVFFGSSLYGLPILDKIVSGKTFDLRLIVTKIDKATGRNQTITKNPVAKFASDHHLPLLQLEEFNKNSKLEITNSQADLGLCVAFGPPYFDQELIDTFPHKIINIHPSPLPKYRGATPGPWQIIRGETKSAVTFFQIDLLPDHGPIITTLPLDISPTETAETFYQKAFSQATENLESVLSKYIENSNLLTPQDHSQKSYFPKFSKDTAKIDWQKKPLEIDRFVRAMIPWPLSWTLVENLNSEKYTMKIFSYDISKEEPINIQIEGKKPTSWSEIKKYYSIIKEK